MQRARGFTLVELVVVVAIIGILVAIAVPSYQNHLRKSRRAEAQTFLLDLANLQQQYLLDARAYALDPNATTTLNKLPPKGVSDFYTIEVTAGAGAPSYQLMARVRPGSPQEPDGSLTLDSTGAKSRIPPSGPTSW